MSGDEIPGWDEILPHLSLSDQLIVTGMLAWNEWVDRLIGTSARDGCDDTASGEVAQVRKD